MNTVPQNETRPLFSGERTSYPREKTIVHLFEAIVEKYPDKLAVVCGRERLTYSELNAKANCLARSLQHNGVGLESKVGISIERSAQLIVTLLGVLKAGGAYVPFDPEYPRERILLMLEDTAAPVLVTRRPLASVFASIPSVKVIYLEEIAENSAASVDRGQHAGIDAESLAYVLFTSGSTGRPKGVLVENRSVVRLVFNTNFCEFGPDQVFLQYAPISFDASTLEIWGALLHGSTLVVVPANASSLAQIGQAIRENEVTTAWLTAGLFHLFVDERIDDLRPLKQLIAGGDVLSARHVRQLLKEIPHLTLINGYGPTEGTTFTCCHRMHHGDVIPDSVPIGKPISNTFAYILDENLQPVPQGQEGELFAAGDGVARGYLNAPALTAERFLPDPFDVNPDARMYRTGDRARLREKGTIEFLGRLDDQVKILGHRIELGEIEAAILAHPEVRQACVVVTTDEAANKRLIAYYRSRDAKQLASSDLKNFLSAKLPAFMVPPNYVQVADFPLNANGKVDRSALPAPQPVSEAKLSGNVEAASDLERLVSDVWKKFLKLEQIGLDENFFDLGGDSLLIVAVHSQLMKLLQREIEVTDLFEFTTVRTLAKHLGRGKDLPSDSGIAPAQLQAQKQREAFARLRPAKTGTT